MKKCFSHPAVIWTGLFLIEALLSCSNIQAKDPSMNPRPFSRNLSTQDAQLAAEDHFGLAQAYSADGEVDQAIEEYKLTLIYDPKSALVHVRLAAEYVRKGLLSEALESSQQAIHLDPKFVDAHLILAGLYSSMHEDEKALAEYEKILKLNPKNEEAVAYQAQIYLENEQNDRAIEVLKKFLKAHQESSFAYFYLGRAEQQSDHFKEAVIAYRKALELKPGFIQAALALGYLYETKQMNVQAIGLYQSIFEETRDAGVANRLATLYLKDEKYSLAIPYLQFVEDADPDDFNVQVKLGLIQLELKNYDQAISVLKKILSKNPEADRVHYYLGSTYEETKKMELAISELKAIKVDSQLYPDATLHIALILKSMSRIQEAKEFLKDAIEKNPKISAFYLLEASLAEESKEYKTAIHVLEDAVKQFPEDEKIHYYLGTLFDHEGMSEKALEHMEAILKLNPENVDALNYIGYTWTIKRMRLNDAEKLLRRALSLRPNNGYVQDSWGWHLFMTGRVKEAVIELEKASHLKPDEPTILEHLGDAYLRSNLREKALLQYTSAVKHIEDSENKKKVQKKVDSLRQEILDQKAAEIKKSL